jgi:hypothetical protein
MKNLQALSTNNFSANLNAEFQIDNKCTGFKFGSKNVRISYLSIYFPNNVEFVDISNC